MTLRSLLCQMDGSSQSQFSSPTRPPTKSPATKSLRGSAEPLMTRPRGIGSPCGYAEPRTFVPYDQAQFGPGGRLSDKPKLSSRLANSNGPASERPRCSVDPNVIM